MIMESNNELIPNILIEENKDDTNRIIIYSDNEEDSRLIQDNGLRIEYLPAIYLADPTFKLRGNGFQNFSLNQRYRIVYASYLSKKISWITILDLILVATLLSFGIIIFVIFMFVFIFPVIGFMGGRRYNKSMCFVYSFYLCGIISLRGYYLYENLTIALLIIQGLVVLLDLYILSILIRFLIVLRKIGTEEMLFLLGRLPPAELTIIPDGVAVKVIDSPPLLYEIRSK